MEDYQLFSPHLPIEEQLEIIKLMSDDLCNIVHEHMKDTEGYDYQEIQPNEIRVL